MYVLPDARRAFELGLLHSETARVVYAVGARSSISTNGSVRRAVLGTHPHLVALGLKDALSRHAPSAPLRPRTVAGPGHMSTMPGYMYFSKPSAGSCGAGIEALRALGHEIAVAEGRVMQEAVACRTDADGYKADVRMWLAIDGTGKQRAWVAPSCLVRVARTKDAVVTNTACGAGLPCRDWEDAGAEWYSPALACARAFCASVESEMRMQPRPVWTLLGADIAVDGAGRGWLLEVNALPHHSLADPMFGAMHQGWFRSIAAHVAAHV